MAAYDRKQAEEILKKELSAEQLVQVTEEETADPPRPRRFRARRHRRRSIGERISDLLEKPPD